MLADIVPTPVAVAESFEDLCTPPLYPQEAEVIAKAVEKRRREFTTSRICARMAMGQLGVPPAPILPGLRGSPGWPAGVVGSMTHCAGYRAAALALAGDVVTIGIDAEPEAPLPDGVLDVIALPDEVVALHALAGAVPGRCWDRLLFSAKEAVYKAWFPLTQRWLDFHEARITIGRGALADRGTFHAQLLVPGPSVGGRRLDGFSGRWLAGEGLLVASIVVEAGAP